MKNYPTLSIVMPCLNEERNIKEAVESALDALDTYGMRGELIIVNDGSQDGTKEIINKLMILDHRLRLIEHERPMGIGTSFWEGVREAENEFITLFPGDNENNPHEALAYFNLTQQVDIIVPFIHNREVRSRWRRFISSIYRFIINTSFGTNLNYTNGTVIYRTTLLKEMQYYSTGFFYQTEILIRLIRAGYLYAEVPHFLLYRNFGKTKALSLKSFLNVTMGYFRLMWNVHVRRKVGGAGLSLHRDSSTYQRRQGFVQC